MSKIVEIECNAGIGLDFLTEKRASNLELNHYLKNMYGLWKQIQAENSDDYSYNED